MCHGPMCHCRLVAELGREPWQVLWLGSYSLYHFALLLSPVGGFKYFPFPKLNSRRIYRTFFQDQGFHHIPFPHESQVFFQNKVELNKLLIHDYPCISSCYNSVQSENHWPWASLALHCPLQVTCSASWALSSDVGLLVTCWGSWAQLRSVLCRAIPWWLSFIFILIP